MIKTTNRHSGSAFRFVKLVCCNRIDRTRTCDSLRYHYRSGFIPTELLSEKGKIHSVKRLAKHITEF
nr:MAG TPA: hypothetical protein [Bacteriophage sp.]